MLFAQQFYIDKKRLSNAFYSTVLHNRMLFAQQFYIDKKRLSNAFCATVLHNRMLFCDTRLFSDSRFNVGKPFIYATNFFFNQYKPLFK